MNERFRFRAWNKEKRVYHYQAEKGACDLPFEYLCKSDEFVIEQCTGLKDKNGVLIYEGDILKCDMLGHNYPFEYWTGKVRLMDGCFEIYFSKPFEYRNYAGYVFPRQRAYVKEFFSYHLEIIGNIHENSELLEDK